MTLKELIKSKMTYKDFADAISVSPSLVSYWIRGQRRIMPYHLHSMAKVLEVPAGELAEICNIDNSLIPYVDLPGMFGISRTTLSKWQKIGYITTIEIGSRLYITRQELHKLRTTMKFPTKEKYYTIRQASDIIGIPYKTLYSMVYRHKIKAYKRPGTDIWWISETNLKKFKKSIDNGYIQGVY